MNYAICSVGAAPVRKRPSHKVEMVNQLLFGEGMYLIKQKRNWFKIQSRHDNYEGWIRNNLVVVTDENLSNNCFVTSDLINQITLAGTSMHIPIGSSLPGFDGERGNIGDLAYRYQGERLDKTKIKPGEEVTRQLAKPWMNAPYLWGGRTPLGVDCSGFVQVIFKMMGLDLLRDARQQQGQGIKVKNLANARCGDLAFFETRNGKISHVGILLSPREIIHASGRVRMDQIDEKGIINADSGKRTHSLATIRRYW
jgi:hypothetical protein